MCIRHSTSTRVAFRLPLLCAGRALRQLPFEAEQVLKKVVAPLCWRSRPCAFEAAGNRVACITTAISIFPPETLLSDARTSWCCTHVLARISSTMGFTERMPTGNESNSFFVIHRHATKGLADVTCRSKRIWFSVRTFRIHIDESHLYCRKRILQVAFTGIAFVAQPGRFSTPVYIFLRFPNIFTPAGETESLKAHRLEGAITGEYHQVCP